MLFIFISVFFYNDTATTEFYTFSLHDALPILGDGGALTTSIDGIAAKARQLRNYGQSDRYHHPELGLNSRLDELQRSEEHTSELQSQSKLVCRLLLEKKNI